MSMVAEDPTDPWIVAFEPERQTSDSPVLPTAGAFDRDWREIG